MHTAIIGGSRGIGRAAALQILQGDPTNRVSLLLRNPQSLEEQDAFRSAMASGQVRIIKGDAENAQDLMDFLDDETIDSVISSLGAVYPGGRRQFSWSRGFLLPSPDVCTRSIALLVRVLQNRASKGHNPPALVVISVTGVGNSYTYLPVIYKVLLPWLLQQTIDDKRGVETILSHVGRSLNSEPDAPSSAVLAPNELEDMERAFLSQILIVRPGQLKDTDGTGALRAGEDVSTYSTGRIELGRWIARALRHREEWMNRRVTVGF